ncbi:hypothetical protein NIES23_44670 [Trichormus variabilis NIES-23]|uniref:Uncharacterized protein n=1 Tax=Trichormus variabilis NIES-23 TaxID=1973479 RepID=A0A1Z4KRT0_ANAVA|nr:hypothetical protein NIES23_44670 [Trichormus variabilis NIES-23]
MSLDNVNISQVYCEMREPIDAIKTNFQEKYSSVGN